MLLPQTVLDGLSTMAVDEPRPGIARITLDRPKQLNALTFASFGELRRVVEALEAHAATRVIVVTGRGRGFCSGLDLGDAAKLAEMSVNQMLAEQKTWADGIASLRLSGLPVIATCVSALPELVADGVTGTLCPCNDIDAFAEAARKLASDPDLAARMSAAASVMARSRFAVDAMVDSYLGIYARVL